MLNQAEVRLLEKTMSSRIPHNRQTSDCQQVTKEGLGIEPIKSKRLVIRSAGRMLCWGEGRARGLTKYSAETPRQNHVKNPVNEP
jgi:hypothetical protein